MKIHHFKEKKSHHEKISILTCYDYLSAQLIAASSIDAVLVGDSVAMTMHGHRHTLMATMDMMILHTQAVARGLGSQFLITDLPFLTHRFSQQETVLNVRQLIQAGAHAVKIEGADPELYHTITYLVQAGIPVMGHIGLTPQSIHQLGGYRVQGKNQVEATDLMNQAIALEKAGCFSLVLECIPSELAKDITETLVIPTIGIGAGVYTDGQVLVWHDMLGLDPAFKPRFAKNFLDGKTILLDAINAYADAVRHTHFPTSEHAF